MDRIVYFMGMKTRATQPKQTAIFSPLFYGIKKGTQKMGFNRNTNNKPSKGKILEIFSMLCSSLKRQASIVEVSDKLRDAKLMATAEDVRHRMQDVRKAHKKAGTLGSYTPRSGFIVTGKTSIIQWDKNGSTPIEYYVGKATAKEVKKLVDSLNV